MEMQIKTMKEKMDAHVKALGLSFERQGDRIQFAFTCLTPTDPGRLFTLSMTLDSQGHYQGHPIRDAPFDDRSGDVVKESVPRLDGLKELERELVRSNDLKGFMISVRRAFVESVGSGS